MKPMPGSQDEILVAVRELLLSESVSSAAFERRVAARLLETLRRETALGANGVKAEEARLHALLARLATASGASRAVAGSTFADQDVATLRAALAASIRDSQWALNDAQLLKHLWQTTLSQLAIDNPNYRWR